jgi:hypothetical protein
MPLSFHMKQNALLSFGFPRGTALNVSCPIMESLDDRPTYVYMLPQTLQACFLSSCMGIPIYLLVSSGDAPR